MLEAHRAVTEVLVVAAGLVPGLGRPTWQADALCREHLEINFFPSRGEPVEPAREVCRSCLVTDECLAFAVAFDSSHGVWAGTSAQERNMIKRAQRARNDLAA